jgi:predicted metalloprotease with PDZ domain
VAPQVPTNGITQGGYKLIYNDTEPDSLKHGDPSRPTNFGTSIGLSINPTGNIDDVYWDSIAFKAGIAPDMQVQAVNDQKYGAAVLREAILAAEKTQQPIKLLLKRGDDFLTISLDYHGGMRYPHLERVESTPDHLDDIIAPSK